MIALKLAARVRSLVLPAATLIAASAPALADGDIAAGREAAHQCEVCHGLDGLSKIPEAPNLAGQTQAYLVKQLSDFKAGKRENEMMSVVVPALTPEDIDNLAAYYSAIEVKIGKIPGQ